MSRTIDLNGDAGEDPGAIVDGREETFLASLTSASVACGGHAGDEGTMTLMVALARRAGVALGAHPSYPDRANFGRVALDLTPEDIERTVAAQIAALGALARRAGVELNHVKPHGALYHDCAERPEVAEAVARAAARWSRGLVMFAAAGTAALDRWRGLGLTVAAEVFADRRYEADGSLRRRTLDGALLTDPAEAAAQAVALAARPGADSICVHGDTPGAAVVAASVRKALLDAGVRLEPPRA